MIFALIVVYAVLATAFSAPLDVTVARTVGGGGTTTTVGNAISALSSGSIVLSGYTTGNVAGTLVGSSNGIVRVYGADGSVLWTNQEATVAGGYLQFVGSATDSSDKIYAVGICSGSYNAASAPGGIDVCVTKYDSTGNRLATFETGGASDDISYGIAVNKDASYLYIVGTTNSATWNGKALIGQYDGFLLKMSISGSTLSLVDVYRFGDTAGQQTQFYAVAYDSAGYVWTAGFTKAGTYQGQTNVGYAGGADFLIQRMKADGTVVFARLVGSADHELAYAIAVDQYTNAYVTGVSFSTFDGIAGLGGQDVPVVMYSGSGVKQWSKTFGGSGNDFGRGVSFDTIKNVLLVTGYTLSAIFQGKTNPITTGTGSSFVLVLNPSDGSVLSVRIYSGSSASTGNAIATNAAGVYLAGSTYGAFQGQTLSGTASAYMLKVERYANAPYDVSYLALGLNPGGSTSNGYDVAMFSNGDAVLGATTTGYLEAPSSNVQLMVQRYSSSGTVLWTAEAGGSGSELLSRVTVDRSDNTFAVGSSTSPFNGVPAAQTDVAFAKFNSTGGTVFYSQFGGSGDDNAAAVAVDSTGSFFYAVGTTTSPILNGYALIGLIDGFVTKIDAATGAIVRHRQFGSGPSGWTYFQAAAIDSTGSLWVAGSSTNAPSYYGVNQIGGLDMFIQKFDSYSGSSAFATLVGGAGDDSARTLSIDANDNLYGVANSVSTSVDGQTAPGAGSSILVVKWNSAGNKLWTRMFGGAGSDIVYASAVDSNRGLLYLTGQTDSATFYGATNTNSAANPFLLVLNVADGSVVYAAVYSSTSNSQGRGVATNGMSTYLAGTANINLLGMKVNIPNSGTFVLKLVGNLPGPTAAPSRAPTAIITRAPTGPTYAPTASPTGPYTASAIVGANPYNSYSAVYGIAGFSNGDVLMAGITTGYLESPASNNYYLQFLFQRFTPSGTLLWSVEAGGNKNEFLTGVAVDVNNVAYASGLTYSGVAGASYDIAYVKITQTSGTSPVATYYQYGGTGDDSAAAVAVDSTGSFFYLVGQTNSPTLQGRNLTGVVDGFVTKINADSGAIVWHRQYGCAGCTTSFSAAALDSAGNLWVTGTVQGGPYYTKASLGGQDLIIQKFTTSAGDYTFVDRVGGTGDDFGVSIVTDSGSNVYAAATSYSTTVDGQAAPGAGTNILIVKWNSAGVKQWTTLYGGDGDDSAVAIAVDSTSNQLVLAGNTNSASIAGKLGLNEKKVAFFVYVGVFGGVVVFSSVASLLAAQTGDAVTSAVFAMVGAMTAMVTIDIIVYHTLYGVFSAGPASFHVVTYTPIVFPTYQPTISPTFQPTRQPSRQPTSQPSRQPSSQPSRQPSRQPTSQPSASPTNVCGAGWTHYGNKCYKTSLPSMTFNACRAYCPSQHPGAGMLCIENSAQNDFIASHITTYSWTGFTNELTNGTYYWGYGCSSTYTNWGVGQPDNFNNRQHWAIIAPSTASPGGVWDDIARSYSCNCEYLISNTCTVPGARRLEEEEEIAEEADLVINDPVQQPQEEQHEILSAAALAAVPAVVASTPKLRGYSLIKSLLGGV